MSAGSDLPEVVDSLVDPDYECVLVDPAASAPPGLSSAGGRDEQLCPPGYVPRMRARAPYHLSGKDVVSHEAPEENPEPPPPA